VDRRPVWLRPTILRRHCGRRKEPNLQRLVLNLFVRGARPYQPEPRLSMIAVSRGTLPMSLSGRFCCKSR
jgi:hypothetical protein